MKIKKILINTAVILTPLVVFYLIAFKPYLREASWEDLFFYNVAVDFNAPDLCGKIHRFASLGAGFAEVQISYTRSECYRDLALKLNNPELCRLVKPVSTLFANGSKRNSDHCIEEVKQLGGHYIGYSGTRGVKYSDMLPRVGFTEERIREIPRYANIPKSFTKERLFIDFYIDLKYGKVSGKEEFLEAVRKL